MIGGASSPFARRIAGVFLTRIAQFGIGFVASYVIASLLGPEGRGAYVAVLLVPGTILALGQLGIPTALGYFAGRGLGVPGLVRQAGILALVIGGVALVGTFVALPALERSVLRAAPPDLARVILVTIPLSLISSFAGAILFGRQRIRRYNVILLGQSVGTLVGTVVLVGILRLGVVGAVATSIVVGAAGTAAIWREVRGLARDEPSGEPSSPRSLLSYGARVYPAGVLSFFSYRADTFLIQAFSSAPSRMLGLYSYAVTVAELVFFVPDSVSSILFPRIAGSGREEADSLVGELARLTVLVAAGTAVAVAIGGWVLFTILLPAFSDAIPALLVILPGVVSLSLSKILTSYISGRGRPGPVSVGAVVALTVNVALNVWLIPRLGIVGASVASLASYTAHAAMMTVVATRMTGTPWWRLVLPGPAEVRRLAGLAGRGIAEVRARAARGTGAADA